MLKLGEQNNYHEFLRKKRKFAKKAKQGKYFKDTDGDGLSDYEEKHIYGTNPRNPDTDGDGINDGREVKRKRNPLGSGMFKDLFIPHSGNDYLPHALLPERLFFHAISLIAMKLVVVIFVLFYPLSAWLSPDMALAEAQKVIELTNGLRQSLALPALLENRQLTQAAWKKVGDMGLNQYFAHVSPTGLGLRDWLEKIGYRYAVAGENLAVGFSKAEDVMEAWKNSPTHYDNLVDRDFKEIGVAMTDGKLNDIDTAFIAQYFAAPVQAAEPVKTPVRQPVAPTPKPSPSPALIAPTKPIVSQSTAETSVQGEKVNVAPTPKPIIPPAIVQKKKEIVIDQKTTTLAIKSEPLSEEKAIQIKTTLPEDTVSAEVIINNKTIALAKESDQTNEWSGASLITQKEEKAILAPLIPASITVENSAGAVANGRVDWSEIKFIKTALLEHYQLFKADPTAAMLAIMNLSNAYFKFILIIVIIAMLLNIFVEIKKQHPHVIFYSFIFIGLLSTIIIF